MRGRKGWQALVALVAAGSCGGQPLGNAIEAHKLTANELKESVELVNVRAVCVYYYSPEFQSSIVSGERRVSSPDFRSLRIGIRAVDLPFPRREQTVLEIFDGVGQHAFYALEGDPSLRTENVGGCYSARELTLGTCDANDCVITVKSVARPNGG